MTGDTEAVLEADHGALIQAEQVACVVTEAAALQIAVEPVCQLKARAANRQPQRGWQVDDAKIRLRELQDAVVVIVRRYTRLAAGIGCRSRLRMCMGTDKYEAEDAERNKPHER